MFLVVIVTGKINVAQTCGLPPNWPVAPRVKCQPLEMLRVTRVAYRFCFQRFTIVVMMMVGDQRFRTLAT